jgi:hypothetical protein
LPTSSAAPSGSIAAVTPPPTTTLEQPTADAPGPVGMAVAMLAVTAIAGLVVSLVRPRPSRDRR